MALGLPSGLAADPLLEHLQGDGDHLHRLDVTPEARRQVRHDPVHLLLEHGHQGVGEIGVGALAAPLSRVGGLHHRYEWRDAA
jgi:hypothetical protein